MSGFISWGKYSNHKLTPLEFYWENELIEITKQNTPMNVSGLRRSYGDVCYTTMGTNLCTKRFSRFIQFDIKTGVLECGSGVTLSDINRVSVPCGWFIPVSPGTKHVSLGGMIANDVHGKNHHKAGSFGNNISELTLYRSVDGKILCSPTVNRELFTNTIGGLGLTGVIVNATVQLKKIASNTLFVEDIPFQNLTQYEEITAESDTSFEYTVAWINAHSISNTTCHGILSRANYVDTRANHLSKATDVRLRVPVTAPNFFLNSFLMKLFNHSYYLAHKNKTEAIKTIDAFFYPLDKVDDWNKLYGKRGFFQYQCVVPMRSGIAVIKELLLWAKKQGQIPYLSVLKKFGATPAVGIMSFPMPGYTIALDFPNNGKRTLQLLNEFDRIILQANGRLYPAKDARMAPSTFQIMYPQFTSFKQYLDPQLTSDFWRRVSV